MTEEANVDARDLADNLSTAAHGKALRGVRIGMLMLAILVVGGWLGWICDRARVQREAVAAIERAGGQVWFDWQASPSRKAGWPRRLLGPGFFEEVVQVRIDKADDS